MDVRFFEKIIVVVEKFFSFYPTYRKFISIL